MRIAFESTRTHRRSGRWWHCLKFIVWSGHISSASPVVSGNIDIQYFQFANRMLIKMCMWYIYYILYVLIWGNLYFAKKFPCSRKLYWITIWCMPERNPIGANKWYLFMDGFYIFVPLPTDVTNHFKCSRNSRVESPVKKRTFETIVHLGEWNLSWTSIIYYGSIHEHGTKVEGKGGGILTAQKWVGGGKKPSIAKFGKNRLILGQIQCMLSVEFYWSLFLSLSRTASNARESTHFLFWSHFASHPWCIHSRINCVNAHKYQHVCALPPVQYHCFMVRAVQQC